MGSGLLRCEEPGAPSSGNHEPARAAIVQKLRREVDDSGGYGSAGSHLPQAADPLQTNKMA